METKRPGLPFPAAEQMDRALSQVLTLSDYASGRRNSDRARIFFALLLLPFFSVAAVAELTVFAAASTATAMRDTVARFEVQTGETVRLSTAASSVLARQIENGAPADLFLSANVAWMDYLEGLDLVEARSRRALFGNRLVVIAPADSPLTPVAAGSLNMAGLLGEGRLAIGNPDHVPAGIYARAALESLGQWSAVEARLAPTRDVRAALALVERGEAPLGIVYRSDARASAGVRIITEIPLNAHPPIVYPIVLVRGHAGAAAEAFLRFLLSAEAGEIFVANGFSRLP